MTVPKNSNPEIGLAGTEEQQQTYAAALVREREGYLTKHALATEEGDATGVRRFSRRLREVDVELDRIGYEGERGGQSETTADTTRTERATPAKPRGSRGE